ncbi:gliding motility-associated C-terminal domain-containing protein [Flavobacterium sp. I-SCBP12n]|uniref:Gliding motility-associated C-terminal domain-containing protein n=2 Tax=Flavobacterium TaxID=237 RepID=A0A9X2BMX7_9FLAO|nr:gliding motility-associated C-terminal domain-containing protein [Flavobacterium pygoscelis]MCK8143326.1 gliding motility-associated C-terminal domain-containing protein [Flavobacterium pygoscelis]MCK8143348.1 gliding motility-associated C-terminal domain-containing protein [Flavobacterium pygoscelis]
MKNRIVFFIFLILLVNYSCNSNDSNTEQKTFLCCGENPLQSKNINNLDQTAGKINVISVFTPNEDGINDCFLVENLYKYSFNSLTIYDLNDKILFTTENYGKNSNSFCGDNIKSGTVKYKLVVKNEQTFVEYGYVCIVKTEEEGKVFSAETECTFPFDDPIIFQK